MIKHGKLDQRVALFSRSVVKDAMGQDTITWVSQGSVWAQRINMKSAEAFAAAQMSEENVVEFHIRHHPTVQTTWRLEWNGAAYDIVSVADYGGRQDRTRLMCRKGVKDGR